MTELLTIERKCKAMPIAVASPEDFASRPAGPADPQVVLQDPNVSLYCLDHAQRRAIFVELDDAIAAGEEPFLYLAQYERAQRLLAVPYETLERLTESVADEPLRLALIHSPGRSGSTLLSKAFQRVAATTSLSEPDVYTQIVRMRTQGIAQDDELVTLLRWATRLLFKPSFTQGADLCVVKFRSWCIHIADLLVAAFPEARNIFLYRDLRPWLVSSMRTFRPFLPPEDTPEVREVAAGLADYVPLLKAYLVDCDGPIAPITITALMWLSVMRGYSEMVRQGITMHAARYEDLVADPGRVLGGILQYAGLPESTVATAAQAFGKDSQEGTMLSRDTVERHEGTEIQQREWEQVRALCERYPVIDGHRIELPSPVTSSTV